MPYQLSVEALLEKKAPGMLALGPAPLRYLVLSALRRLLALDRISDFFERHRHLRGTECVDEIFQELGFSFYLTHHDRARIPAEGKLVVVANHPLGGLDGLALIRVLREVRPDVRIVANDVLLELQPLAELFLPVDVFQKSSAVRNTRAIDQALEREEAVIIFPAGEVSRMKWGRVTDGPWNGGPVFLAKRHRAPVLPVHIGGRNSLLFYLLSSLSRPLSTMLLPREMLRPRRKNIELKVGGLVPASAFETLRSGVATKLLRKQTYALKWNHRGPFKTECAIIHPVQRQLLLGQLEKALDLGSPAPGKRLYLATADGSPAVIREIARLRELTFRRVGEGTGRKLDSDPFDMTYSHLVVWEERTMEIAGAYRLGVGSEILQRQGPEGLYTSTLFDFSEEFRGLLPNAMELGRSFIQHKYWNSYTLDYLWAGIGAVVRKHPQVQYLFGPVSVSNTYPAMAKQAIVHFHRKWYAPRQELVSSKRPFEIPDAAAAELEGFFCGKSIREDFNKLKLRLRTMNLVVPTLYRQYAELCEPGGVVFDGAGIDPDFGDCVDSFVVVDIGKLTASKRERYIERYAHLLAAGESRQAGPGMNTPANSNSPAAISPGSF